MSTEVITIKNPVDKYSENTKCKHLKSYIHPDTLFNFTRELDWLISMLKNKMLSPRYVGENISYLNLDNITKIYIPMKCFCDISLHKLDQHMECYGSYGIAFSKEWGMKQKIQPVQYINPNSKLCEDISEAFNTALSENSEEDCYNILRNYLIHQIMYLKPYQGPVDDGKKHQKCFTEECEWRYIADTSKLGYNLIYFNDKQHNIGNLIDVSNSLDGNKEISINFDYPDIKHIIIKNNSDFITLTNCIDKLNLQPEKKYELISKIIVWESSKGDF